MPSTVRAAAALGLVLVVAGTAAAGYGVYERRMVPCESSVGLSAWVVGPNDTVEQSTGRVAFENLSPAEQRVFRAAVEGGGSAAAENRTALEALHGTVVEYRGDRYETVTWESDCPRDGASFVAYGGLAAVVGGVVAGGALGWRRFRAR